MKHLGWAVMAAFVLMAFGGCGVTPTEKQKELNAMNQDAGDQLSKHSDPDVAQTGTDIRENSKVLESTLVGKPAEVIPYTAAMAAKLRAEVLKEFEANQPWYKKFAGTALSVLSILAMGGMFAARFFPATAPIMNAVTPILGALTAIKQKADANPGDTIHINDIQPVISSLTTIPKYGPMIADKLKDLHLDQIIHAPEAPDVAAPAPGAAPMAPAVGVTP